MSEFTLGVICLYVVPLLSGIWAYRKTGNFFYIMVGTFPLFNLFLLPVYWEEVANEKKELEREEKYKQQLAADKSRASVVVHLNDGTTFTEDFEPMYHMRYWGYETASNKASRFISRVEKNGYVKENVHYPYHTIAKMEIVNWELE